MYYCTLNLFYLLAEKFDNFPGTWPTENYQEPFNTIYSQFQASHWVPWLTAVSQDPGPKRIFYIKNFQYV